MQERPSGGERAAAFICPAFLQQPAAIRGKAGKIDEALFLVEENAVWDSWHRALEQVVPPGLHSLIALTHLPRRTLSCQLSGQDTMPTAVRTWTGAQQPQRPGQGAPNQALTSTGVGAAAGASLQPYPKIFGGTWLKTPSRS